MRRTFGLVTIASVSIAVVCCGEAYAPENEPASAPDAGALDAGEASSAIDAPVVAEDAGPKMGAHVPRCPRPPGPSCELSACERRILYAPPSTGVEFPYDIATDSSFVYWTSMFAEDAGDLPYDGIGIARIRRVARAPGSTPSVIADGQRNARWLAMAGDYLYWLAENGASSIWELRRVRRDCPESCVVENVGPVGSGLFFGFVAIDDETLLATQFNGTTILLSVPMMGSASFATVTTTSDLGAVAATSTDGFASGGFTPTVRRIPAATGVATALSTLPDASAGENVGLNPLTTDCTTVFGWRGGQHVWRIPIEGGVPAEHATLPVSLVFGLVTDRDWIYAASPDGFGLAAISNASGARTMLRAGNIHRVAVDDVGVYWGDHDKTSSGPIWMMVK